MKITTKIIIKNNKIQKITTDNTRNNKKRAPVELSDSINEVLRSLRNKKIQYKKPSTKKIIAKS